MPTVAAEGQFRFIVNTSRLLKNPVWADSGERTG